jgi:hypothetical protein
MTKPDWHILVEQLRQEAHDDPTPITFSPLLHERIMSALRRHGLSPEKLTPPTQAWFRRAAIPLGIAAALAVAAGLFWPPASNPPPEVLAVRTTQPTLVLPPESPAAPEPDDLALAANTLSRGKYAYLDRDAEKLFRFVTSQLPSLPLQKP